MPARHCPPLTALLVTSAVVVAAACGGPSSSTTPAGVDVPPPEEASSIGPATSTGTDQPKRPADDPRPDHYPEGECGAHEPPTAYTCQNNEDCEICHDGSSCGVVVDLASYLERGEDCRQQDAAQCELSWPACVSGRCVRCGSLAPP